MSFSWWIDRDRLPIAGGTSSRAKEGALGVHGASKDPSDALQESDFAVLQLDCMLLVSHKLHFSHLCSVGVLDCNPRGILFLADTHCGRVPIKNVDSIVSLINA